jgi:hypothetical protein
MSADFSTIDDQIQASYQSASQVKTSACQLEARIAQIDGARPHLPSRRYGQPVDLAKIRSNLTLTSLIAQDSAELAHFCGIDPASSTASTLRRKPEPWQRRPCRCKPNAYASRTSSVSSRFCSALSSHRGSAATGASDACQTSPMPWMAVPLSS